jgi:hypothetical protein
VAGGGDLEEGGGGGGEEVEVDVEGAACEAAAEGGALRHAGG